jgi:type I restriction enzyme ecoR124II specificity protein
MPHYPQDVPFEVPKGWVWCLLEELAYVAAGSTPNKDAFVAKGIPYIKMYNLRVQKIDFDFHPQYIKREIHEGKLHRSRTEIGDLLMNIVGPPLGKLAVIPSTLPEGNFNQAAVLIRPYHHKELLVKYLFYYLSEMSEINSISTKGSAGQVNISLTQSQNMRIPLPPLAEQQRIVEEIERLFKLIDIIEQGKVDLQTAIKQTKSKILDLAIHGKLVPQDPSDEPASELLKRINPKAQITCDNEHSEKLPKGWYLSTLGDCFKWGSGGTPESTVKAYYEGNIPWLVIGDLNDSIVTFASKHISQLGIYNSSAKVLTKGTLLMAMYGSIGKLGIAGMELATNQAIAYAKPNEINTYYLFYYLLANRDNFYMLGKGGTQKNISQTLIKSYPFLLPPLAEQKRIVLKIEELFSIIDTVEQTLQA